MTAKDQTILTYGMAGLVAGVTTGLLSMDSLLVLAALGSLPVAIAMVIVIGLRNRHRRTWSWRRIVFSGLLVSITLPSAVVIGIVATNLVDHLLQLIGLPVFTYAERGGYQTTLNLVCLLVFGGVVAALLATLSLGVITKRLDNRVWMLFSLAGIGTGLLAVALPWQLSATEGPPRTTLVDPTFAISLFTLGCTSFAAVFGYGMWRSEQLLAARM